MSSENTNNEFDELLRLTVIREYAGTAAEVSYNQHSWTLVQKSLEQRQIRRKKILRLQTIGLILTTLILCFCVFYSTPAGICPIK
ncbi:hypothetical protein [Paenibacillus eucommiae]|uniref:Uncharacterized protein n=1 Tax=Paenibacillus eucommiae TaxID=1355755 RepID=A0ABS4J0L2_9BACL|nr:hypothetical protein [Paenibacillus eucommiae]MBP1993365.1 hypothetical protein [Paenibacillus eucommiae]